MDSIFYEPCCEILKANAPNSMSANVLMKTILAKYPNIQWSGTQGPVRAMLLKAASLDNCPIRQVPKVSPPLFFYSNNGQQKIHMTMSVEASPEEIMDDAALKANAALKTELLKRIREMNETDFETLVNKLISKMGYGRAENTQKSNDRGIDGFIYGDRLGLNVICVQSKRYDGHNVQRPAIQQFIGALKGRDGIFVTSADFSPSAKEEAKHPSNGSKIALIDGNQLVSFMIEYNIGVQDTPMKYVLKQIDQDFFEELSFSGNNRLLK